MPDIQNFFHRALVVIFAKGSVFWNCYLIVTSDRNEEPAQVHTKNPVRWPANKAIAFVLRLKS